jgi:formamidopyrimidine-DNA glycosylase
MPELPEVETIRRGLFPKIVHKSIRNIDVFSPSSVRNPPPDLTKALEGNQVSDIQRIGKLLVFHLARSPQLLLVHLKMTGQLLYQPEAGREVTIAGGHSFTKPETEFPGKYTRIAVHFADTSCLFFNDIRRFGFWQLVSPEQYAHIEKNYGIEPGRDNFTRENFVKILNSSRSVKAVLLDQTKIAGLGNIYVDEACFRAGIRPHRPMKTLVKSEWELLFDSIQTVIATAIEQRGTSFRDYRDSEGKQGNFKNFLQVYARTEQPCVQCGRPIQKTRLAGRGTHFCAFCQK